jgi:hypothetical protein
MGVGALVPATALADDRQLSTDYAEAVDAHARWVSWHRRGWVGTWVAWRAGQVTPLGTVSSVRLGSDARGRAVALYRENHGWPVRERLLPSGPSRPLVRNGSRFMDASVDEFEGTVAVAVADRRARRTSVYVRRAGDRRFVQVSSARGFGGVTLGRGWLAYVMHHRDRDTAITRLHVTSFERRRPRTWMLVEAVDDLSDNEPVCNWECAPGPDPSINGVALHGRYVYWDGDPEGDWGIFRTDLRDFESQELEPGRPATSFAVGARGRIVYSRFNGGVFVVDQPRWRTASVNKPALR